MTVDNLLTHTLWLRIILSMKKTYRITYNQGFSSMTSLTGTSPRILVRGTYEQAQRFSYWYKEQKHILANNIIISEVL